MARLIEVEGTSIGKETEIGDEPLFLGRDPASCGLLLRGDGRVSRRHAQVTRWGDSFTLEDLGSANGTFLNGSRVFGSHPIKDGDLITVGKTVLRFDKKPAAPPVKIEPPKVERRVSSQDVSISRFPVGDEGTLIGLTITSATAKELAEPLNRLRVIYHFADVMRQCRDMHALVEHILDAVFQVVTPDRAAVLLNTAPGAPLETAGARSNLSSGSTKDPITVSNQIVTRCLQDKVATVVYDATTDDRFDNSESIQLSNICSAICCPLVSGNEVYGVIYADTVTRRRVFNDTELEMATGLANQAAMALGNAMHHQQELRGRDLEMQLELARRIHRRLLPEHGFQAPRVVGYGWNRPSSSVGGDYFGFFEYGGGYLVAIGDSTGHGIGAALVMTTARAYLVATLAHQGSSLSDAITVLNRLLSADMEQGIFVSFLLAWFDPFGRQMRYVSAGHEPPLLYRPSEKRYLEMPSGGVVLGLDPEFNFHESQSVTVQRGDRLCFFTDGVTEQENSLGQEFGAERLKGRLAAYSHLGATDLVGAIVTEVDNWRGSVEQSDDLTLVVIEIS